MNECFLFQKSLTELMNINWKKYKNKIKKNCVKRLQIQLDTGYVSGTPKLWWITNKTFGYPEVLLECSGHSYNEVSALKPCLNFRLSSDARCTIAVFIPAAVWNYYCVHTHTHWVWILSETSSIIFALTLSEKAWKHLSLSAVSSPFMLIMVLLLILSDIR